MNHCHRLVSPRLWKFLLLFLFQAVLVAVGGKAASNEGRVATTTVGSQSHGNRVEEPPAKSARAAGIRRTRKPAAVSAASTVISLSPQRERDPLHGLRSADFPNHSFLFPIKAPKSRGLRAKQEEHFHTRPSIRLMVPDILKGLLVDDWENVTKNLMLVPLPSPHPVNAIMDDYLNQEKTKRRPGSAEADVLEEVVQGVKEYFDKALGRILLYRFERDQLFDVRRWWESGKGPGGRTDLKGPGDVYGPEHLARLFGEFLLPHSCVLICSSSPVALPFKLPFPCYRTCQADSNIQCLSPSSLLKPTWTPRQSTVSARRSSS